MRNIKSIYQFIQNYIMKNKYIIIFIFKLNMSLEKLKTKISYFLNSELTDYQFRQTLIDDCIIKFTTIPVKDWDRGNIVKFLKERYEDLKLYAVSVCKQDELVDFLTDYHDTIESYIEKYKPEYQKE